MPGLLRFAGAAKRHPAIGPWLDAQPGELGSIARTWFARMRGCGAEVRELVHDGYATACVEDAPFAYVGVFKDHVNVGFFHGDALPDPAGLLQGVGRYMRHVKVKPGKALDESSLEALPAQSSMRFWPPRSFSRSSIWRRLGSASALNTASMSPVVAINPSC